MSYKYILLFGLFVSSLLFSQNKIATDTGHIVTFNCWVAPIQEPPILLPIGRDFEKEFSAKFQTKKVKEFRNKSFEFTFQINRNGSVEDITVVPNQQVVLDQIKLAMTSMMTNWKPGLLNGQSVRSRPKYKIVIPSKTRENVLITKVSP